MAAVNLALPSQV